MDGHRSPLGPRERSRGPTPSAPPQARPGKPACRDREADQEGSMRSILDDPSLTRWTWAVLALLLAATAFLTIQGRWLGVAVLGGTVACSVAFIRLQAVSISAGAGARRRRPASRPKGRESGSTRRCTPRAPCRGRGRRERSAGGRGRRDGCRESHGQDVAEPAGLDDRHAQGHEALARDGADRPDAADHRPQRPDHLVEAVAVGRRPERRSEGAQEVEALRPGRVGQLDRLPQGLHRLEALRFRVEPRQVRLLQRLRDGQGVQDLDLRREIGLDPVRHPHRGVEGGASRRRSLPVRGHVGDPAAEQQHRDGGREHERDKGAARSPPRFRRKAVAARLRTFPCGCRDGHRAGPPVGVGRGGGRDCPMSLLGSPNAKSPMGAKHATLGRSMNAGKAPRSCRDFPGGAAATPDCARRSRSRILGPP